MKLTFDKAAYINIGSNRRMLSVKTKKISFNIDYIPISLEKHTLDYLHDVQLHLLDIYSLKDCESKYALIQYFLKKEYDIKSILIYKLRTTDSDYLYSCYISLPLVRDVPKIKFYGIIV